MDSVPLWINGQPVTSTPPTTFDVHSLAEKRNVLVAQSADKKIALEAADAAQNAFKLWKSSSAVSRRKLLLRVADEYRTRTEQFIRSQVLETSCTETWAQMNVEYAIKLLEEIAARTTSISGEIPSMENPEHLALVFKEPIGPMLTIAP